MSDIARSSEYETYALDWLFGQVERLKAAMIEGGILDDRVQRSVCASFVFGLTVEFDNGEVMPGDRPRPRLGFERDGRLLLPDDDSFDFHDYALGVVGEVFGDA
jgi:hypothetical protein